MGLVGDSRKILWAERRVMNIVLGFPRSSLPGFILNSLEAQNKRLWWVKLRVTSIWQGCGAADELSLTDVADVTGDTKLQRSGRFLPREADPFCSWRRFRWWISSRSPGGTWQTWAAWLSPAGCVSIPCRSSDRTGLRWCWSRNTRPGTQVEGRPGISQRTTARWLRVRRGGGSARPGQGPSCPCPCQALHPRLASQDPLHFTGSTWSLDRPAEVLPPPCDTNHREIGGRKKKPKTAGFARLDHDHGSSPSSSVSQGTEKESIPCFIDVWGSFSVTAGLAERDQDLWVRAGSASSPPSLEIQ